MLNCPCPPPCVKRHKKKHLNNNRNTIKRTVLLVKKFAGEYLINYAKKNKSKLEVSNYVDNQTSRFTHFIELIYPIVEGEQDNSGTNSYVYNSSLTEGKMNTSLVSQIIIPSGINTNDNNYLLMDLDIIALFNSTTTCHPLTQTYEFVNDNSTTVKYNLICEVEGATSAFQDSYVYRNNSYVFYPGTMIYLLFDRTSTQLKIYVMQVFTNKVNNSIRTDQIHQLTEYVTFPTGFTFGYYVLERYRYLRMQSLGKATVINDTLKNAYMLLSYEDGKFIYDKYV